MYLKEEGKIWAAQAADKVYMLPEMANRHGLVAGATGTGKTVSIRMMAEAFSDMGVPVFLGDIKGDVSGMCKPGVSNANVERRVQEFGIEGFSYTGYPVCFFDVYGKQGIPVRATASDIGPELFARVLDLNATQASILSVIFKIADDQGLLLLDLKDLRAMVRYVGDNAKEFQLAYGNISAQSVGAIQRALLVLEQNGGDVFFGEPALDIRDWMTVDEKGRGKINLLNCTELIHNPLLYSTFLLWMLSELYETLPEAGDINKPKIVFFFDEAHLLFSNASKPLLQKVEQVVRLIRSKGVGIYFITQVPSDIPDSVLSQLGNKVQHALRAYSPKDQKAVKAAASSFRANPAFDCEKVLGELGIGEALVSFLDQGGTPQMVQRAFMLPPQSFLGVADDAEVRGIIQNSPLHIKYGQGFDRESAFESLQRQAVTKPESGSRSEPEKEKKQTASRPPGRPRQSSLEKMVSSTMNTVGREVGRQIVRGILGSLKK